MMPTYASSADLLVQARRAWHLPKSFAERFVSGVNHSAVLIGASPSDLRIYLSIPRNVRKSVLTIQRFPNRAGHRH